MFHIIASLFYPWVFHADFYILSLSSTAMMHVLVT